MTNSISVPVLHIKVQELLKKIDKATDRVLMVMGDIYIRPVGWLNSSASAKSSVSTKEVNVIEEKREYEPNGFHLVVLSVFIRFYFSVQ